LLNDNLLPMLLLFLLKGLFIDWLRGLNCNGYVTFESTNCWNVNTDIHFLFKILIIY